MTKENILIESDRLSITKIDHTMYMDIYYNSQDEDLKKFVPDEVFSSIEEAKCAVNQIILNYEKTEGPFVYAVIRKEDKTNIGYMELIKIEESWEIGYHIAKPYTRKGYASEATMLFIEYLKRSTDIKAIIGISLLENVASCTVLEKCGFELYFKGNGIYQGQERRIIKTIKRLK